MDYPPWRGCWKQNSILGVFLPDRRTHRHRQVDRMCTHTTPFRCTSPLGKKKEKFRKSAKSTFCFLVNLLNFYFFFFISLAFFHIVIPVKLLFHESVMSNFRCVWRACKGGTDFVTAVGSCAIMCDGQPINRSRGEM